MAHLHVGFMGNTEQRGARLALVAGRSDGARSLPHPPVDGYGLRGLRVPANSGPYRCMSMRYFFNMFKF
jgi:hypothetical protein